MLAPFQPGIIPGCRVSRLALTADLKSGVQLGRFFERGNRSGNMRADLMSVRRIYVRILRQLWRALDGAILQ